MRGAVAVKDERIRIPGSRPVRRMQSAVRKYEMPCKILACVMCAKNKCYYFFKKKQSSQLITGILPSYP